MEVKVEKVKEASKNICSKLLEVQSKLVVGKERVNEFGKFKYRSCEDILIAVKPLLKEQGLLLLCSDKIVMIDGVAYLEATAKVFNVDNNEVIENTAYAKLGYDFKGMSSSQMTGASSSYGRKYALNGLFAISDVDPDELGNKNSKPRLEVVTNYQIKQLEELGVSVAQFCEYKKADSLKEISKQEMDAFLTSLKKKRSKQDKQAEGVDGKES